MYDKSWKHIVCDLLKTIRNCQINEIKSEHKKWFSPDALNQAHLEGYDN